MAASITLTPPALVLVHSDQDCGSDNPLIGRNDPRFGPRFPHMGDLYPAATRAVIRTAAAREGIEIKEGMYVRVMGPNYERPEDVYRMRAQLRDSWREGSLTGYDRRFGPVRPVGVVGMSSTFEQIVAQQATQSDAHPAFRRGRAYMSAATNYAASLGLKGFVAPSEHSEVEENAALVQDKFGRLVRETLLALRPTQ